MPKVNNTIHGWLAHNKERFNVDPQVVIPKGVSFIAKGSYRYTPKYPFRVLWLGKDVNCIIVWARCQVVDQTLCAIQKKQRANILAIVKRKGCSYEQAKRMYAVHHELVPNTSCMLDQPPVVQIGDPKMGYVDNNSDVSAKIDLTFVDAVVNNSRRT